MEMSNEQILLASVEEVKRFIKEHNALHTDPVTNKVAKAMELIGYEKGFKKGKNVGSHQAFNHFFTKSTVFNGATLISPKTFKHHSKNGKFKVFDWNMAARLIKELNPLYAFAGLLEDFNYTGGLIYANGQTIYDNKCWLSSNWATPILLTDRTLHNCYIEQEENILDPKLLWPTEALEILKEVKP